MTIIGQRVNESAPKARVHYYEACAREYRTLIPPHSAVLYCGYGEEIIKKALQPIRWSVVDLHSISERALGHAGVLWDYIIIAPEMEGGGVALQRMLATARLHVSKRTRIIVNRMTRWATWWHAAEHISSSALRLIIQSTGYESAGMHYRLLYRYHHIFSYLLALMTSFVPGIRFFASIQMHVLRPLVASLELPQRQGSGPSVSIIMPCRNEEGTINESVQRMPSMGLFTELICIEGGSADNTLQELYRVQKTCTHLRMEVMTQTARGKGNAVTEACARATGDILMIFDGDMTVDPEAMLFFYDALVSGQGDLINGTRLVFPMEKGAMRFPNWCANKGFALLLSLILGRWMTDTLCGTKVCWRSDYERSRLIDAEMWKRDPFGDFAWLFSTTRWGGLICEVPILYRARKYGAPLKGSFKYGIQLCWLVWFLITRSYRKSEK